MNLSLNGWLTAMDPAVTAIGVILGVGAILNSVVQGIRAAPRYVRYRLARRFFRFRNGQRILIVCSELDNAEQRQWVEPNEFIYMLKYGDLDALFGLVSLIREIYPRCRLEILSSNEALSKSVDLECDLILIGGPDYNKVCERVMAEADAYAQYVEIPCDDTDPSIALCTKDTGIWKGTDVKEDYGYLEVVENPFAKGQRVFFFGGCHTIGVTGATKMFQLKNELGGGLTKRARENIRKLIRFYRFRARMLVIFRVTLLGATVPEPNLSTAQFFGPPRKFLGVGIEGLAALWHRLGRTPGPTIEAGLEDPNLAS
ncbi:hypothetical protein GCM10023232_08760 [Sphingosinicella ginsenosidimutans]|uniref:Uncharacterized protein n=1 Tax=Allosphingosinicella ginsenosidimutans TaxID=1176539 RepID=A0A5C6TW55_9SPHN|nr:hypothetical protein [Sphingosinicella ginsenosidimutans]TXC64684.1 hypothetical protein FRZ32_14125 [Sphingosinicella ginsenosidimutans]